MIKIFLYLFFVIVLGGTSAWVGQRWRYEGAIEESNKKTAGSVLFEQYKANAEAAALKLVAERERDGEVDASVIVQAGKAEGRKLGLQGDSDRATIEQSGELATQKYYLDPTYGSESAISELKQRLKKDLASEERENTALALRILLNAREETNTTLSRLRTGAAQKATHDYVWSWTQSGCAPSPSVTATSWGGVR